MNYSLNKVTKEDYDLLYRLLEFALYDGSMYVDNTINEEGIFEYKWFDNYFTDEDRDAYIIKGDNNIVIGFVFINEHLKFNKSGKSIAEFLILPTYRRNHIGSKVAVDIFNMYPGMWEVQPMENNPIAYKFWENTINKYTNGNYIKQNDGIEDVFIFKVQE